jgi:hypothetical protein
MEFWGFRRGDAELLATPFRDEFLEGSTCVATTKDQAKLQSFCFTNPAQVHGVYEVMMASNSGNTITLAALDAVFGIRRAGKNATCLITVSSVSPDMPCPNNSLLVRRHVPMPKALTTAENAGTAHALLKATVWVVERLTGKQLNILYLVKDMGGQLQKAAEECGIPSLTDIEHIRAGPGGCWKEKIVEPAHRILISRDLSFVEHSTSCRNFQNTLQLFYNKWTHRGESVFVEHFKAQRAAGVITRFDYGAMPHPGYANNNNQTGERHYRSMKGQPKLNKRAELNTNRGIVRLTNEELPKVLGHDSKKLERLHLQGLPLCVSERTVPSVFDVALCAVMKSSNVHTLPSDGFLCNSADFLGKQIIRTRIESWEHENNNLRVDFNNCPLLREHVERTSSLCHVRTLDSQKVDGLLPLHLQHLSEKTMTHFCTCKAFHQHLSCAAQQCHISHEMTPSSPTSLTIEELHKQPFDGGNNFYKRRGRQRVQRNMGAGLPTDTMANMGLHGDYADPGFRFLCSLTVATLTTLCRMRNVFPRWHGRQGRTKSVLLQLFVANTCLGDEIAGVAMANHASHFLSYHRLDPPTRPVGPMPEGGKHPIPKCSILIPNQPMVLIPLPVLVTSLHLFVMSHQNQTMGSISWHLALLATTSSKTC